MIIEIYNQEIRIFVDSFVTMRLYVTPTETPLCQLGPLLLPVMDCQPSCSGGLLLELESSNVLLAVSLKRAGWREAQPSAGQGSWGIFLSYELKDLCLPGMLLWRDMYGVLGIFVFGSLVTQLLTDTSKYTIGELAMPRSNMKSLWNKSMTSFFKIMMSIPPRPTPAALSHSLSTQYNFDQHSGSLAFQMDLFFLSSSFEMLDSSRCVVRPVTQFMSPIMAAWARWDWRMQRERLVHFFYSA